MEVLKLSGDAGDDAQSVILGSEADAMGLTHHRRHRRSVPMTFSILNLAATSNALTINTAARRKITYHTRQRRQCGQYRGMTVLTW